MHIQVCAKRRRGSYYSQDEGPSKSQTLETYILLSKGAFCTPRSIMRSITTKKKPSTAELIDIMKTLADSGIGKFEAFSEKEKVYFKPLPTEEALREHVDSQAYQANFEKPVDAKYITAAQYNRILDKSPNKDILISKYNYSKR